VHTSKRGYGVRQISIPELFSRLVDHIVPQVEQLPNDLIGLTSNSIVVHDIGRKSLTTLDLLGRLARVVIVDIHLKSTSLVKWPIINPTIANSHLLGTRLRIQEPRSC
jgi:hypothetical protein